MKLESFFIKNSSFHCRQTKTTPSISYSENPNSLRGKNKQPRDNLEKKIRENKKETSLSDKSSNNVKNEQCELSAVSESSDPIVSLPSKQSPSLDKTQIKPEEDSSKVKTEEKSDSKPSFKSPTKFQKSPEKFRTLEKLEETTIDKISKIKFENCLETKLEVKPLEKAKVELKIERKKSPKRIEKPKVNIFLEDSDEVDEFEKNAMLDVKCKWSSPEIKREVEKLPTIVPAPMKEFKLNIGIPTVVESPERSPVPEPLSDNMFESSSVLIGKSPTPSPPPNPTKVRNVCSFLSDIASGTMFSGLGFGSGLYDEDSGLKEEESLLKLPLLKKREVLKIDLDSIMEPDTTADKIQEQTLTKASKSSDDSDSDDSDSSSSSSDSDDTTSESEESSEESSDEDVPTFTGGFGRFDASSMPMVTQIKPLSTPSIAPTPTVAVPSLFQSHQSLNKTSGLLGSVVKPAFYSPAAIQPLPTAATPFPQFQFPIPFKIYSLRDVHSAIAFPTPVQPVAAVSTPANEKSEKEKKPAEKAQEKRDKDRKRSHSRERDRKRKDERKKTPPRRRSPSPVKKRIVDDKRHSDSRRKDSNSHTSRASHGSRYFLLINLMF